MAVKVGDTFQYYHPMLQRRYKAEVTKVNKGGVTFKFLEGDFKGVSRKMTHRQAEEKMNA